MSRFAHFELSEFIYSKTARDRGIDNTPSFEVVEHIAELCEKFLEPLRVAYGKPITINSGYRCPKLNQAVGGVANSAHKTGYAADLSVSGNINTLFNFITEWVKACGIRFDQIFLEHKGATYWVHIGLYSPTGTQRGIISRIKVSE